ncbi:hypothetical protein BRADI_1g46943v3 [Brachypodium distachyon]|uniref:Uncharacterized protein n=1 Tax=Brachypodium distachyon TaxID=15368 RepID=A0A0Q3S261_BRADI|nr:hypothetical protein BRADI_1g46943v3 [Brachypodium distachyon]
MQARLSLPAPLARSGTTPTRTRTAVHAPPPPPPPLIASAQLDERSCRWPRNPSPPTKLSAAPVPSLRPPLLVRSSTDEAACARPIPCDEEVPRVPDDRQDLTSANPTPACRRRMPRTGFTDDGDASMFSWLRDSDGSSSVGTELKYNADYFDPDWLIEHEFDDEVVAPARPVEDQGLNRGAVLAQQNRLLASMVDEEKCKNKELYDALINREIELAFQD